MKLRLNARWASGLTALLLLSGSVTLVASCLNDIPAGNPDSIYIDHGNGTVTDTRSGLMWKQCAEGLSGMSCQTGSAQTFTWPNALVRAESSTFADYTDWRLPNIKELWSLVEDCSIGPAINVNRFPNTPRSDFWSGSPNIFNSTFAWNVFFDYGGAYVSDRSSALRVRLVREGR